MTEAPQQFARTCLFCGKGGVTKTHVYAKSFTGMFEADGHEAEVRHDRTDPESGETETVKRAKTFAFKPKAACEGCNRGWMRELEEALRPVLKNFAENQRMLLYPHEQKRIALWATVAALVQMQLEPVHLQFADPEMGARIYANKEPAPGTQVWIGANTHGEMGWFGAHSLRARSVSPDGTWGAALSFGYGNVHIVHHGQADRRWILGGPAHHLLTQVWPTAPGVWWPPRDAVGYRDLSPVAELIVANVAEHEL